MLGFDFVDLEMLGTAGCVSPTRVATTRDEPFTQVVAPPFMRTPPWERRAILRQPEYTVIPAPDWSWAEIPEEMVRKPSGLPRVRLRNGSIRGEALGADTARGRSADATGGTGVRLHELFGQLGDTWAVRPCRRFPGVS